MATKPPPRKNVVSQAPKIVKQYIASAEELEKAKLVQLLLPWVALEAFAGNRAKDSDWLQIQYWLYYAEALVALHYSEPKDENTEVAINIGYSIQALYAVGKRYNESGYKVMTATVEELDTIRLGLLAGDVYKAIVDENLLLVVGRHVQKVLTAK